MNTKEKWFLSQDNSCHWYLVLASKRKEWNDWKELPEDDPKGWDVPCFAKYLNSHPSQIEFYLDP